ncbi:MAG TPA: hypothetical protein VF211_12535 [Burkholderiales bacterium]
MRIARGTVLLGMALAPAACATMSSVQDGQPLAPGEGFLARRIDSNTIGNLWYTAYSPTDSIAALPRPGEVLSLRQGAGRARRLGRP